MSIDNGEKVCGKCECIIQTNHDENVVVIGKEWYHSRCALEDYECSGCGSPMGDPRGEALKAVIIDEEEDRVWCDEECKKAWEDREAEEAYRRRYEAPDAWEGGFAENH